MAKQSGNARWTVAIVLVLLIVWSVAAARGRVRVNDRTVVADNGMLLRATNGFLARDLANGKISGTSQTLSDAKNKFHLNAVRAVCWIGPLWRSGARTREPQPASSMDAVISDLDKVVETFDEMGMYLIIDDHSGFAGDYNHQDNITFWDRVAPRYKDRTHVIYEIKNEPLCGAGDDMDDKYNRNDKDGTEIAFHESMYQRIRTMAPQTHIICWSFCEARRSFLKPVRKAPGIDYSNASVAFHPYVVDLDWSGVREVIDAGYPVVAGECGYIGTKEWSGISALPGYFTTAQAKFEHHRKMSEFLGVSIFYWHLYSDFPLTPAWPLDDGSVPVAPRANSMISRHRGQSRQSVLSIRFPRGVVSLDEIRDLRGRAARSAGHAGTHDALNR